MYNTHLAHKITKNIANTQIFSIKLAQNTLIKKTIKTKAMNRNSNS